MQNIEKIEWIKCTRCGFLQYKQHLRCLKCKNTAFEIIEAKGNPRLITYTILTAPPIEFWNQKPYAIGIVEFENGIKSMGQIINFDNLETGILVKPIFKKVCNNLNGKEIHTYVFEPII